jgi:hypothetical protein
MKLDRVMRAKVAMVRDARVMAGSIRDRIPPVPEEGSQWTCTLKSRMRSMPLQKEGML